MSDTDRQELIAWRQWATFVFLGGGPVSGTDEELQRRVCEAWDAAVSQVTVNVMRD